MEGLGGVLDYVTFIPGRDRALPFAGGKRTHISFPVRAGDTTCAHVAINPHVPFPCSSLKAPLSSWRQKWWYADSAGARILVWKPGDETSLY